MTLSPPVRVLVFVGALAATGLAAFMFLMGRGGSTEPAPTAVLHAPSTSTPARVTTSHPTAKPPSHHPKLTLADGLPNVVAHALRYSRVVVVAVYVPSAPVDAYVRGEAQAGAKASRAGYVGVSASSESALQRIVAKTGVLPDPAVIVFKRPGNAVAILGVADRETIAQAVLEARGSR